MTRASVLCLPLRHILQMVVGLGLCPIRRNLHLVARLEVVRQVDDRYVLLVIL